MAETSTSHVPNHALYLHVVTSNKFNDRGFTLSHYCFKSKTQRLVNSKFLAKLKKTAIVNLSLLGKVHAEAGRIT